MEARVRELQESNKILKMEVKNQEEEQMAYIFQLAQETGKYIH